MTKHITVRFQDTRVKENVFKVYSDSKQKNNTKRVNLGITENQNNTSL